MKPLLGVWIGASIALAALSVPARAAPVPDSVPIALLVDLSSGQTLYARAPDRRFVPASVTKTMTAFTAFKLLQDGPLTEDQRFVFSAAAAEDWHRTGSTMFLEPGNSASVRELLMAITTVSANDGSVVLAEGAAGSVENWLGLMNANAADIGMRQTHFGTPNGWPDGGKTFTTARDLVILGRALVEQHPQLYARYFGHRGLRTNGIAQDNHDPITGRVQGADGIKTGFTNQAGFNFLGSAIRGGRRLMMVLAGAPEEGVRDKAARDLIEWGFNAFDAPILFRVGTKVGVAEVQDGDSDTLSLVADRNIRIAFPKQNHGNVSLSIHYEGPLRAPISKGEQVAELQISVEGMEPARVPLRAAADVAKANAVQRIRNAITGLLG